MSKFKIIIGMCALMLAATGCQKSPIEPNLERSSWIGMEVPDSLIYQDEHAVLPAYYLQKTFDLDGEIREAWLFVSVMGYSDCFINGEHVSDYVYGNLPSQYDKTIYYNNTTSQPCFRQAITC